MKQWLTVQQDEPWKYTQWKKPDREDYIFYASISTKCPEQENP